MALDTPRHAEYACEETHPGMSHTEWIALENKTGGTDASEGAAFIGKIGVPETDDELECDHDGTTLIRMDGVPKEDEGYACARCGTRFVAMWSAGKFHRAQLIYVGNNEATDEYARIIPSKLLLDGLNIKGVTDVRFEANLKGDARKIWVRMIVRSFEEIVVPKEEASVPTEQTRPEEPPQGDRGGLAGAVEGDGQVREAAPRRRAGKGADRAGKPAGGA